VLSKEIDSVLFFPVSAQGDEKNSENFSVGMNHPKQSGAVRAAEDKPPNKKKGVRMKKGKRK